MDVEKNLPPPPPSKIILFHYNFNTKSNNSLFITLKDNRTQLINGEKRKDDENEKIKQN